MLIGFLLIRLMSRMSLMSLIGLIGHIGHIGCALTTNHSSLLQDFGVLGFVGENFDGFEDVFVVDE